MRKRFQFICQAACLAILAASSAANGQTSNALPPTLRGEEAVNQLKQNGQYDSLMQAVKAARKDNGQIGGEQDAPDAIGQSVKLTASDGAANDQFGQAVAISGDTAVVGAWQDVTSFTDQGSAYVFVRSGTTWTQQQKLTASAGAAFDLFGGSVSISGDTIIVGSVGDTVGGMSAQGSAYIFTRSGTVWTQQQKLTAADGASDDSFGSSVVVSGNTAIIGAYGDDNYKGAAYVFVRSGTIWSQQQKLTASDGAADDTFGVGVAISSETVIVGAYGDDNSKGSAYVFVRSGTSWTQQQKLTAADGAAVDYFGSSVAISGDTVIVSAFQNTVGANANQGAAYVFTRSGTSWSQQQKLTAADGAAGDLFGSNVAISGDTAVVGAYVDDVNFTNQGSAYVFTRSGTTWTQQEKLTAADGAADDEFGQSVAISGNDIMVGALLDNIGTRSDQGSVYMFRVLSNTWTQEARNVAADGEAGDEFGYSVAIFGDTAIVGAYTDDIGANTDQGSAYIFIRSGASWTQQAKLVASDGASFDYFGAKVAISGDTVIIGAYFDTVGSTAFQGSAYVFTRSGTSWTQQARLVASDGTASDYLGLSVDISENTAIVGAIFHDVGEDANQGAAYVFLRSGSSWSQQAQLTVADGEANDQFGVAVAISGDTAIVGAYQDDVGANADQGSAYAFVRSGTSWTQQAQFVAADGAADDQFGFSVAISGDTAVIGAITADVGANINQGAAYVFGRTGAAWTQRTKLVDSMGAESDQFGISVSIFGDKIFVGGHLSDASALNRAAGGDFVPQAADQGAAIFFVNAPFAPTAAAASIGGRVFAGKGRGLANATVYLTDSAGNTQSARTNPFGYYRFDDIAAGQTVIVSVTAKRYRFAPQVVSVSEDLFEQNFFPDGL